MSSFNRPKFVHLYRIILGYSLGEKSLNKPYMDREHSASWDLILCFFHVRIDKPLLLDRITQIPGSFYIGGQEQHFALLRAQESSGQLFLFYQISPGTLQRFEDLMIAGKVFELTMPFLSH